MPVFRVWVPALQVFTPPRVLSIVERIMTSEASRHHPPGSEVLSSQQASKSVWM
jgi:hypothetical protein